MAAILSSAFLVDNPFKAKRRPRPKDPFSPPAQPLRPEPVSAGPGRAQTARPRPWAEPAPERAPDRNPAPAPQAEQALAEPADGTPILEFELLDDFRHGPRATEGGIEMGPDLVLFFGNKIVVCSPKQMYDWEAKGFERPKIMFQGRGYYLSRILPGDEERPYRYELAEWPEYLQVDPKHVIEYNEEYVSLRDGRFKKIPSVTGRRSRLIFLYPLLGFAWSGTKKNFLEPHGFNPLRISLFSCLLAYAVFMAELISFFFFASGVLQWSIGNHVLWVDYCCLLILPVDAAVRFFQIVNGNNRYPDGFLEWVFSFLREKRAERLAEHDEEHY